MKSEIHLLTLTPFFPSLGDEVNGCFIAESTRALKEVGVTSGVIAVSPLHHRRKLPDPSAPAHWVRYPQIPGTVGLSNAGRWLYLRLLPEISRLRKEKRIDLIHAHAALPCGHAAALLSRRFNIPFVVTVHGLDAFNTCFVEGAATGWRRESSIDVYRSSRNVICISQKVEALVRNGMRDEVNTSVVYNGTDTEFFSPPPATSTQPQEKEILIVGSLLIGKGHELVLRSMRQLQDAWPQLRCRIIGEGADRVRFEALANQLGISDRVKFEGPQTRAEVAEAMRQCSIFALPCHYEGLGCVYLEAMSTAKPAIACCDQGIDEIIEHGKNGWLIPNWVKPSDAVAELSQGLATLLASPELCASIGTAARETILKRLTLSHQAERLAQIYREAIA